MTDTGPTYVITSVSFDPDVLYEADSYRHELRRKGTVTTRSALVNTALHFYLQHVRETGQKLRDTAATGEQALRELARKEQAHA